MRKLMIFVATALLMVGLWSQAVMASPPAWAGPPDDRDPEAVPPGLAQQGPPEFAGAAARFGATEMAREQVRIKGSPMDFDLPPVIKQGRVLVPVRAVTNGFGAEIKWDPDEQKITIFTDDITIELYIGELAFYVNGEEMELDIEATLLGDRTFVPLRFIAQALGGSVIHNPDDGSVDIEPPHDEDENDVDDDVDEDEDTKEDEEEEDDQDDEDEDDDEEDDEDDE